MSIKRTHASLRNSDWCIWQSDNKRFTFEEVTHVLLMDIREELRSLNRVMQCPNVAAGFRALQEIARRDERAFKRRVNAAVRKRLKRKGL